MRWLFFLTFTSASLCALAQKARDYSAVVKEFIQKIEQSSAADNPVRIAVVPFTSSQGERVSNGFGEYITESITAKLSEQPHKFKVFERTRLDAILKENELMLSGLMKPSEAIRIGQLLPIDALLSGTYTKLKSYIDISGRLIDVASGEILVSFSGRIKLSKNLQVLFSPPEPTVTQSAAVSSPANTISAATPGEKSVREEDRCAHREKEINSLLEDLSTPQKVDHVVKEATQTPFDNLCGKWHHTIINRFMRYKVYSGAYGDFLLTTLRAIPHPSLDDRAYHIFSYLCGDGSVSASEWDVMLQALARTEYAHYRYLSLVFDATPNEPDAQQRIDQYMYLVTQNKLGTPQPVPYNQGFFQLMQGLSRNHSLQVYTYERYSTLLATEPVHSVSSHMLYLNRMYEHEKDPKVKTKILRWTARYFQEHTYEKSPEQLYDYAYKFDPETPAEWNRKSVEEKNREKAITHPLHDLHLLIDLCRDKFSAYATQTPYESTKEKRISFCIKYNIDVPGAIPTLAEAEIILKSNNLDEQLRVLKLLVQMESKPKPLQPVLVALLDKRSLDEKEKLAEIQTMAIQVLGQVKTTDAKAINHMISQLTSYNYKASEASQQALLLIGKPGVQPLIKALAATTEHEGGLRYKLIVLLGKLGPDAKPAESLFKKLLSENKNADIRYALEAALQSIGS